MTETDHWQYFNYAEILREAKARLAEARAHPTKLTPEKDTLEYWCAWAAHANAASVLSDPELARRLEAWAARLSIFPDEQRDLKSAAAIARFDKPEITPQKSRK
jgi:hypothetical protein